MLKYIVFLKWWLFTTAITVAGIFCYKLGGLEVLADKDTTKLSFLILTMFSFMSLWCGVKTWRVSRSMFKGTLGDRRLEFERMEEVGWFTSELCLTIGMIGTVCGFIMMLSGFANIDIANTKSIQDLISKLGTGMSTALYTTLVGLICCSLLKIQYFNLSQAIASSKPEIQRVGESISSVPAAVAVINE